MFNRILSLGVIAASLAITGPTVADVVEETFEGATLDQSLWYTRRFTPMAGHMGRMKMLPIDGKLAFKGRGGGAGCVMKPLIDWNDSLHARLKVSVDEARPTNGTTRVGVGFMFGPPGSLRSPIGIRDGVRLEIRSTGSQSVIQFVANRQGHEVQASDAVAITPGSHTIDLYWFAEGADQHLDIRAYLDGDLTKPVVQIQGLPETFINRTAAPVRAAIFATASTGADLNAAIEEFTFSGDFRGGGDSNDSLWNDKDPTDADEPQL